MRQKHKGRKPRVVIDTSVLVAGISSFREPFQPGRNASADVLQRWVDKEHFTSLVTEEIFDEYKAVLKRLRVRSNLIGRIVNLIRERAEEVIVRTSLEISPDPKDDPFCICAELGGADFIITLNPRDFPADRVDAVVTSPDRFLAGRSSPPSPAVKLQSGGHVPTPATRCRQLAVVSGKLCGIAELP